MAMLADAVSCSTIVFNAFIKWDSFNILIYPEINCPAALILRNQIDKMRQEMPGTQTNFDYRTFLAGFEAKFIEKLSAKIDDPLFFPQRVGPDYVYTLDHPEEKPIVYQLKESLYNFIKEQLEAYFRSSDLHQNDSIKNEQSQSVKGKAYNKYSIGFKRKIIDEIEDRLKEDDSEFPKSKQNNPHKKKRYIILQKSKEYKIHPKNILRWYAAKEDKGLENGRKPQYPELEEELIKFIERHPNAKRRVIIEQAKKIMERLKIGDGFGFSKGWYERFRCRLNKRKLRQGMAEQDENRNQSNWDDEESYSFDSNEEYSVM